MIDEVLRHDFDSPWKEGLEDYFPEFMAFFFPLIAAEIDWEREIKFLDTELQQVVRDADLGRRWADKLVQVWRKDGQETWVLCHIEVQSQKEDGFAERMLVYNYRLRDRYNLPIVSLAVLSDDNHQWRPRQYETELWGCGLRFWFPVVKLLDYGNDWPVLEESDNPFSTIVMAHLKTQSTRKRLIERKDWKLRLTRRLYERGYARREILNLYRFIDWLMILPEDLADEVEAEITRYEQEGAMPYVTRIERQAEARGAANAERALVLRQLARKFGELSEDFIERIDGLSVVQVETLADALLDWGSIADLEQWLAANQSENS
jgi:Domain of unknown function (DUF4351)